MVQLKKSIPFCFKQENTSEFFPKGPDGVSNAFSDVDYLETWSAMEHVAKLGLTKSIGLSNFNSEQIKRVLEHCTIKPAVNEVNMSVYF